MILGVTDVTRLPRLGKIRLGEKTVSERSGKEYPAALDHFNFRDVPEVAAVYAPNGEPCRELFPVLLPDNDENVFFPTCRVAYRASGWWCRCSDGETATRFFSPNDAQGRAYLAEKGQQSIGEGQNYEIPCMGEECPYTKNDECSPLGRLFFILPTVPRFGVYEIATGSFNSIVNVTNFTRSMRNMAGTLSGLPFALLLKPLEVQPDGKKKTVYVLELQYRGSYAGLVKRAAQLQASGGRPLGLLQPTTFEDSVPDDLYPLGGQRLEARLEGKPIPLPHGSEDLSERLAGVTEVTQEIRVPEAPEPPVGPPAPEIPAPGGTAYVSGPPAPSRRGQKPTRAEVDAAVEVQRPPSMSASDDFSF